MRTLTLEIIVPGATPQRHGVSLPLTERTRRSLTLAVESARALGHAQADVRHVLLGVVREGQGVGFHVLNEAGVKEDDVWAWVERGGHATSSSGGA